MLPRLRSVALLASIAAPAAGAMPIDTQPQGSLSGKIVYLHAGHGWTASPTGTWFTQRPETFEIVEDLTNHDFVTIQAEHLWNAGATIVPLRPLGHQTNEAVLDNDDQGVSFNGPWFDSSQPQYFGTPGDVPYRFAFTAPEETAVARYEPNLPAAGRYPVYAWTLAGSNRVEQLYRIHHAAGTTEVTIDHRLTGGGLVYLGTYHFNTNANHAVEISNRSPIPGVVIADMIRFGNGMGDTNRGTGVSGVPRHDEAALYWIETHRGVGTPNTAIRTSSNDESATVTAPPRWATYMNQEATGDLHDRVFLSHHSNAATGTARGVISLLNGNNIPQSETPNQLTLAIRLAREINDDMVAQNGRFEHNWANRSVLLLDRSDFEFGEINNTIINNEFDATIVERAFHDNELDAELLRDARVNHAMARATTQGLIRYFDDVDPDRGASTMPPPPPLAPAATALPDGSILLRWQAPTPNAWAGDAPTGYAIEQSPDGQAFARVLTIPGAASTSAIIQTTNAAPHHFRIRATNPGGQSQPTEAVSATPASPAPRVLIINGFERIDRFTNVREPYRSGVVDRVIPDQQNNRNYTARIAESLSAAGINADATAPANITAGLINLADYRAAIWLLGNDGFNEPSLTTAERTAITNYLNIDGGLIIGGTNIARELSQTTEGNTFLTNTLATQYLGDSAAPSATGAPGLPLEPTAITIGGTFNLDPVETINPTAPATEALRYPGFLGTAAVFLPGVFNAGAITLGFPTAAIADPTEQSILLANALATLGITPCPPERNGDGTLDQLDALNFILSLESNNAATDTNNDGTQNFFDLLSYLQTFDQTCP